MADRTYVFRLTADSAGVVDGTNKAGKAVDDLGKKAGGLSRFFSAAGKDSSDGVAAIGESLKKAGGHAEGFSLKTAAAKRELIVLAHEASQGNFTRLGGSLLVLAEQTGAASFLFSAMGLAVGATVGTLAGFAFEVAKGAAEQDHFNKSLALTGNLAGQTNDSIEAASRSLSDSTGQTIGDAHGLLAALESQGDVGQRTFGPLAEAMLRVQKLSGQTTDEVVSQFKKLATEPAKGAAELSQTFNFLDSAAYEHIHQLEEMGDKEGAALVAIDALNVALKDRQVPALSAVGEALKSTRGFLSEVLTGIRAIGHEDTFEHKLDVLYLKLQKLKANGGDAQDIIDVEHQIGTNIRGKTEQDDKARRDAADAETKRAGVAAQQALDALDKRTKGTSRLTQALAELAAQERAQFADRVRLDPSATFDIAAHNRRVEQVTKDNTPAAARHREDPGQGLLASITAQREQLKLEQEQVDSGGKLDETQKFLATSGEKLAAINSRISVSERQRIADGLGAVAAADQKLKADRLAAEVADDTTKQIAEAQRASVAAADEVDKYADAQNRVVDLIKQQGDLIGRSALDRERIAANEKLDEAEREADRRLQLQAQREIENGNTAGFEAVLAQRAALHDQTEQIRGELIPAIEDRFAKERAGYTGVRAAIDSYRDNAANSAQFAQQVTSGGLDRLTNDIADAAETGKTHFGDLWKFMADEFLRQLIKMQIASAAASATSGSGGILSAIVNGIGAYFGAGSVTQAGSAAAAQYGEDTFKYYGTGTAPGHALGGDFKEGQSFMVGEHGPERVYTGGQSGRIVSNSDLRQAANKRSEAANDNGPRMVVNIVNNSSGKVTQQQTKGANGVEELRVLIEDVTTSSVASGGRLHDAISKRFGVGAGGTMARY